MTTTTTTYRYIGGTRNLDGHVTCTTGVDASNPEEAKRLLAIRMNYLYPGHNYSADDIGIVQRKDKR